MAQVTNPNQALYIVAMSASSGFFVTKSEKYADENAKKSWYKYQESERKKIQAVRQSINVVTDACCPQYFGLKIANDVGKEQIQQAVNNADVEMKKIDSVLKAEVDFIKLPGDSFTSGTMLDKLTGQIRSQILEVAIKKIERNITKNADGVLPQKTKERLLSAIDRCRAINVISDEGINQQLDSFKERINADEILMLRDEILTMLDTTKSRFEGIEMLPSVSEKMDTEPLPGEVYVVETSLEEQDEQTTNKPARKPSRFDID